MDDYEQQELSHSDIHSIYTNQKYVGGNTSEIVENENEEDYQTNNDRDRDDQTNRDGDGDDQNSRNDKDDRNRNINDNI